MRPHPTLLALLGLCAASCDEPPTQATAPPESTPGAAASAAPGASAQAPAPAPPADLDVGELQKTLQCATNAKSGPCVILAKFAECKPWSATVPSGDGRWIGRASVVSDGKAADGFAILRLKHVPLVEVGPGQLPAKIALAELTKAEGAAFDQADRAVRAFERGDVPPRSSPTLEYVKQRDQWPDAFAMKTAGGQVYAIAQGGTFLCQGPKQQLLAVQRAATRGGRADGIYAELWATSW